jgi:hypothetical protein
VSFPLLGPSNVILGFGGANRVETRREATDDEADAEPFHPTILGDGLTLEV